MQSRRVDTSKTQQILVTIEMNTLRKIRGKRRINHVRIQDIRQQCEIQPVGSENAEKSGIITYQE
jgi:hypothetical protein